MQAFSALKPLFSQQEAVSWNQGLRRKIFGVSLQGFRENKRFRGDLNLEYSWLEQNSHLETMCVPNRIKNLPGCTKLVMKITAYR